MKVLSFNSTHFVVGLILFGLMVISCHDEPDVKRDVNADAAFAAAKSNNDLLMTVQEVTDITDDALLDEGVTTGKRRSPQWYCLPSISGSFDIDRSHPDTVIYSGSLTIDYGDGSACEDSTYIRKGKIINSFIFTLSKNETFSYSKVQTIIFEGFVRDSIQLDGTLVSNKASDEPTTIDIQDAKITYPDNTFFSWSGMLTIVRGSENELEESSEEDSNWEHDSRVVAISGSLNGATREGASFTAIITNDILYKYSCRSTHHRLVPVSGTVEITTDGVLSIVDYGDGSCDKTYTITTGEETTEYTFGNEKDKG